MTTVRGTANILVDLDGPRVEQRLSVLAERCDVLALQEWARNRNGLLRKLGTLAFWPRTRNVKVKGDWTFHRPLLGGGPIGVRTDLDETPLSCKAVALVGPGRMDPMPGRRTTLGPSFATRLKSRRWDGSIVVRYNIHLTASVQRGQHSYRHDAPKRGARHQAGRRARERHVARGRAQGVDVAVYGDTNFHHMPIHGVIGWWSEAPHDGTLGSRAIDGIWTSRRPDDVAFLASLVPGEHRHVITTSSR